MDPQAQTIAFLEAEAARAGAGPSPVATHISRIFFAGERVFKLKRALATPYLDYSTPRLRLSACEAELTLNRRTAPALYLAVRRITRERDGLAFDGAGELVDAIVEMKRFDDDLLFDRMAQRGALNARHMDALAASLATFHAQAEASRVHGGAAGMEKVVALNETALRESFFAHDPRCETLLATNRAALARLAPLLDARRAAGQVRRCHGDLTLRNICLIDGAPTPFDCLEFDEALATTDVLYDLAFPLMDLQHRGQADLANALFNRYLDRADHTDGLALLPFFIAQRALVRAHITATMAGEAPAGEAERLREEAKVYFDLALAAQAPDPAELVAVGGFSGSGKSTVAAALAPRLGAPPGARVLSSDRIRKTLFGVEATERLPVEAYAPEVSERVYAKMREEAARTLRAGWPVVADAVFDRADARRAIAAAASAAGAPFRGIWLRLDPQTQAARIAARQGDPSDATPDVLRAQIEAFAARGETMEWTEVDAAQDAPVIVARLTAD